MVTRHGILSLGTPVDCSEARRPKAIRLTGLMPANLITLTHLSGSSATAGVSIVLLLPLNLSKDAYVSLHARSVKVIPTSARGLALFTVLRGPS
jgi:hypothetical protein